VPIKIPAQAVCGCRSLISRWGH